MQFNNSKFSTFMDDQCKYNTYTCYIYNQLQFIDHPKNTLSYSIFYNLKSIQICSQIQFSSAIQFSYANRISYANQFRYANQFSYVYQFSYVNQFNYANQFSYVNQFSYALNEFNLCIQYTGFQSHRHGPAGLQVGIKMVL